MRVATIDSVSSLMLLEGLDQSSELVLTPFLVREGL